jgi:hypothetical protein
MEKTTVTTETLASWLLRQIAEDEATAPAVCSPTAFDDYDHAHCGDISPFSQPAHVLAVCAAHRAIVQWCSEREQVQVGLMLGDAARESDFIPGRLKHPADSVVLRYLASAYADRDGFREEWR